MVSGPAGLLRLEDARERMLHGVEPLASEMVALVDSLGRVLAEQVLARHTLPPWDNSAMDGFAVLAADTATAAPDAPVRLHVAGEVAAGHSPTHAVTHGIAVRVLTGAMLPPGADAVVPVEDTDASAGDVPVPAIVAVRRPATTGDHVRRAGSDIHAGAVLLDAGSLVRPATMALIAAGGRGHIRVHRRPRVAVLGTGDELVVPGEQLGPAQIPDSNSVSIAAQARAVGAEVLSLGLARDRRDDVLERIRRGIASADVVVASGGVSVGAHDVVKEVFESVGHLDLWRVAIQPGKPIAFGRARPTPPRHDRRDVLLFGLPGNPVSSFVTFELFVRPVLRRLAGHRDVLGREIVLARLAEPVQKSPGRRAFLRVTLDVVPSDAGTVYVARLAGGQGSHVLSALASADGLAAIPEERDGMEAGELVEVIRFGEETL